jgi:ribosomal protein L11
LGSEGRCVRYGLSKSVGQGQGDRKPIRRGVGQYSALEILVIAERTSADQAIVNMEVVDSVEVVATIRSVGVVMSDAVW